MQSAQNLRVWNATVLRLRKVAKFDSDASGLKFAAAIAVTHLYKNVIEVLGLFIGCLISTFHGFFAYGPEKSFLFPPNIVFSVEVVAYFYDIVMSDTS